MVYNIIRRRGKISEVLEAQAEADDAWECRKALEQNGFDVIRVSSEYRIAVVK